MYVDILICSCMEVYESTIIKAIKEKNLSSVSAVGRETGAGTICGSCIFDIQDILDRLDGSTEADPADNAGD
jgi:NAD(P)H-nitrite reductase large subunit